ncbi:synaptonemal complex protein 2-like [Takifugu flavidus]|uniref:Synaptonemal complex protein 2 n=1 Tax=Takifugu flavidus TaxID=433684 RepID=A0A5C6MP00_9TELE|nr:synaptonemal complex protein 2-like [Takifugu flavidus]TWW56509.1 Synaptonemal complex protein 2 [Takifugu flavidus]
MTPAPSPQLESIIDEVLKTQDVHPLDSLLQSDPSEVTPVKCSQQFLTKLHKLIIRGLNVKDYKSARLGLTVLHKWGEKLKLCDRQGLPEMIAQGLHKKMLHWYEECRQLWIQGGPKWDEALLNLSEDFFDALMVVHDSCKEGTYNIAESFLCPIGLLAVHPKIYILIQKEAIQKFNLILDKIPLELKKKMKMSMEALDVMVKLAVHILDCGDHDFQTALTEALCRITPPDQRKEVADRLFHMEHVAGAFVKLRDSEFETECRKFLNLVNGMQGDTRRVFSYPCLEVYLDKNELLMPADDELEEFWIDFNTGSQGISFYFSLVDAVGQDDQWETLCITVNELQSYSVTDENKRCILRLNLSEVVVIGAVEGSRLTIHFSSSLDIPQAASKVFGLSKNRAFTGKTTTSVVKTTINVLMGSNSSQAVPESQLPFCQTEKEKTCSVLPAPSARTQEVTSDKRKQSESSFFIQCNVAGSERVGSLSPVRPTRSIKGKPSLKMVRSNEEFSERLRNTANSCSETTPPNGANGAAKEQNIKHTKPAALGGEDFLGHGFVPDTQPRSEGSISSKRTKLSVSEMLIMPTQKIHYLPKSESRSNQSQMPSFCLEETDTGLTQGPLQKRQDAIQQESITHQVKTSDRKEDSKSQRKKHQASKEQQVKRNDQGRGKQQMSPKMEKTPGNHSAPTTKGPQERVQFTGKTDDGKTLSSKEKKNAELAGSMVKLISSHYKDTAKESEENVPQKGSHRLLNRPVFNMSWFSSVKKEVSGSTGNILTNVRSKTAANYTRQRKDFFTFNTSGSLSSEEKCKSFSNISATSISGIHDSTVQSVSSKQAVQPVVKGKRHVKKHLFSDTDTDYVTSEVSWLKESSRKNKPKVAKYSRQAAVKSKPLPSHSIESTDLPPSSPKSTNGIVKFNKQKKAVEKPAAARTKRPRRAAATSTKTYKEPETDDSQSEFEEILTPKPTKSHITQCSKPKQNPSTSSKMSLEFQVKKKRISVTSEQPSHICSKLDSSIQSGLKRPDVKKRPVKTVPESSKFNRKDLSPADQQMNALRDSWAACQDPPCASPPLIENMRSVERSAPNMGLPCPTVLALQGSLLSASPNPPRQDTPSPIPLLPDPCSAVSSKGKLKASSIYSTAKNHSSSKTRSLQYVSSPLSLTSTGPNTAEARLIHQDSPPPSPFLSEPLLTSTLKEMQNPSVPMPPQSPTPGPASDSSHYVFSEASLVSSGSLSTSFIQSEPELTGSTVKSSSSAGWAHKKESSPPQKKDVMSAQHFMSGPSLKRRSHFEENEEKKKSRIREQSSFRMKPRKLFTSFTTAPAQSPVSHAASSTGVSCTNWDPDEGDMDMEEELELPRTVVNPSDICQKLSSEFRNKFENRHTMMEVHNKQSLTAVQQHLTSLNMQLNKCQTDRLEKVLEVLLGEIDKLEQDEGLLKTMEKDLTTYWKKQSVAFSSYHEQEKKRNETLKKALQGNVSPSLDYEESLFMSQMCLIRKDMKTVQDRLLTQMHEGEILTVKRGLHALFFP